MAHVGIFLPFVSAVVVVVATVLWRILDRFFFVPLRLIAKLRAQGIPGYPFRPVVGQLPELFRAERARSKDRELASSTRANQFLIDGCKGFGKEWILSLGSGVKLVSMDPSLVRQVYITQAHNFRKPSALRMISILGQGLVSAEGELWLNQRRIINPAFHARELQGLFRTMAHCARHAVAEWEAKARARPGEAVEISQDLAKVTLSIITATAFGMELTGTEEGERLLREVQVNFNMYFESVQSFRLLSMAVPVYKYLPTLANRRMWRSERALRAATLKVIQDRIRETKREAQNGNELLSGGHKKVDLLQLMLDSMEGRIDGGEGAVAKGSRDVVRMSERQLMDECLTFLAAGHETTAVLLTWTLYLLSVHPEWQNKAREEVRQLSSGTNWTPSFEEVGQMKLCHCILQESLRLYPPAAAGMRHCIKDTLLNDAVTLPAGCDFFVAVEAMHIAEEYWGPDAEKFNPGRFAEGVSKATSHPGAYMPFGLGQRVCIGQNFALLEGKLILALILLLFSWTLAPSYHHHPALILTMRPKHGLPIILKPLS